MVITDTGEYSPRMLELASTVDILFLEANYNDDMLRNGPYPMALKDRILSIRGHLSNKDAAFFLNTLKKEYKPVLKHVYFCHLSENNCRSSFLYLY